MYVPFETSHTETIDTELLKVDKVLTAKTRLNIVEIC